MNSNFENQKTYYLQGSSLSESTEGGLNLSEVTSTVMRKLPLIASITIAMTSLAFVKTFLLPPVYVASVELLPETVNVETKVTSIDDKSGETREEITLVELDDVQLKILKSPQVISRAIDSLQDKYPQLDYQTLNSGLTVGFIRDSQNKKNVLSVSYQHSDKQQVSDVIDVLTQTYLDYSAEKRSSGVQRGITVLEQQIPLVASQVDQLENQLQNLRNKYNFIEPEVSLNPITNRSSLMTQEQDKVASELQQMRLKLKNLDRELQIEPTTSPTAIELATPRYLGLLNQLREIDAEISRKSAIFSDRTAQMQVLNEERQKTISLIRQAETAIRQKLVNEISTLENRQTSAQRESAELRSQLRTWSTVSNDYNKLQQKLELAKNQLNEFTLQRDALLIDAAQQETPWQLLAPAGEPYNNDLGTSNRLLLGSAFGLLLGVGIALILDKHQKIIYTSDKVEEITNLPVLGNIPYTPKKRQLSLLGQTKNDRDLKRLPASDLYRDPEEHKELSFPEFFLSSIEAFRSFAANLGLLNFSTDSEISKLGTNLKSLAITSAASGEGKSTVALNLARATASLGRRVLLVDADVRSKVRLTESLGLKSEIGLKNILNQNSPSLALEQIIKKSPLEDNLDVLTSGCDELMSSESSRLLASGQMYQLMEELKSNYDLVIYDLCAVVGYADVNLLAAKTDGVVLVTALGKIDKTLLSKAINQLKMCNVPILGIAVNNIIN